MSINCELSSLLLEWYDRCARIMPWRDIHDPYKTWISEVMLQQTRVDTVIPYYNRFVSRFPTLSDLAAAEEKDVLKLWEGLGYYSRARNLLKGACQVMEQFGGVLPDDADKLKAIKGIGPYTAGAIASIAYGLPVPAVDGNVLRVYSRIFGIRTDISDSTIRKKMDTIASSVVPPDRPGDYNQAVMDLGATICIPGTPDCDRCPVRALCNAFSVGDAQDLPVITRSVPQKIYKWSIPVICCDGKTLIRCRTESLLHGLWVFPMLDCAPSDVPFFLQKKYRMDPECNGDISQARHVFTHQIWEMSVQPITVHAVTNPPRDYKWYSISELDNLPFPVAMKIPLRVARGMI